MWHRSCGCWRGSAAAWCCRIPPSLSRGWGEVIKGGVGGRRVEEGWGWKLEVGVCERRAGAGPSGQLSVWRSYSWILFINFNYLLFVYFIYSFLLNHIIRLFYLFISIKSYYSCIFLIWRYLEDILFENDRYQMHSQIIYWSGILLKCSTRIRIEKYHFTKKKYGRVCARCVCVHTRMRECKTCVDTGAHAFLEIPWSSAGLKTVYSVSTEHVGQFTVCFVGAGSLFCMGYWV